MAKQFHYLISVAAALSLATITGCGDNHPECGADTRLVEGVCAALPQCGPGTMDVDGTCQAVCADGTMFDPGSGLCQPDLTGCAPNMVAVDGVCRDAADVVADVMEGAEPNGFEAGSMPGAVDLPDTDASVTIGGCSEPQPGADPMGPMEADFDVYLISAGAPMVIDVAVDGYNGMAGAFAVIPLDGELNDAEWGRIGLNLVDDIAQREVLLPKAGDYALAITDSRSFTLGPSGDGSTCYLATVTSRALPAPTPITDIAMGVLDNQVQAYIYDPNDADVIFNTGSTATTGALIDTVVLINGVYHQSAPGLDTRDPGDEAATNAANLADDDEVIIYVEAVADFSSGDDDYTLEVFAPGVQPLPADGSTITIDNDGNFFRWVYFDAVAGDVVHLDTLSDAPAGNLAILADSDLLIVSELCNGCAAIDSFMRFDADGRYYIALFDFTDPQPPSFQLTSTITSHTPVALPPGSPQVGLELDVDGSRFYTLSSAQLSWWQYVGEPTGNFIGELDVNVYPNGPNFQRGALGVEIQAGTTIDGLDATTDRGGIFDQGTELLVHARDDGFGGGAPGTFDLGVIDRNYIDLGVIDAANGYMDMGLTFNAGETYRYLMRVPQFSAADIVVTGDAMTDLQIQVFDAFENATVVDDDINAGGVEATLEQRVLDPLWVAIGIREWQGNAGGFDITINGRSPPFSISESATPFVNVCPFPLTDVEYPMPAGMGQEVIFDDPDIDDGAAVMPVSLQFAFDMGGEPVTDVWMNTNGYVQFAEFPGVNPFNNAPIPSLAEPNFFIAPLWDDYRFVTGCYVDMVDHVIFQWNAVQWAVDPDTNVEVQLILRADNSVEIVYGPNNQLGTDSATVGFENSAGDDGYQLLFEQETTFSRGDNPGESKSWLITP